MIKVLSSGLWTTIQDLGRFGYRNQGVPVSGAMDLQAARLANHLLGNSTDALVIEITLMGPKLVFTKPCIITITGANLSPKRNGKRIENNTIIQLQKEDILSFGKPIKGCRSYIAIAGGIVSEKILGSHSFYKNITKKERLEKGDVIEFSNRNTLTEKHSTFSEKTNKVNNLLEVYKGPEFNMLNSKIQLLHTTDAFVVSSKSNRMAYILDHALPLFAQEITTAPVQPGTVQLTPSGKLIILMRDAQTTGGYARILQLTEEAINLLAQKQPNEVVGFKVKDTHSK